MSNNQVVKVPRDALAACMTCPICNKLFRDATTIPECLHTFCRKCIHKKLSDEELECCPVCNIDLGCAPLEKLRPDHNLQDIRAKIFPSKRRKVKAPEVAPSVALPSRRKERSLSALVVSTPRVSTQTTMTGKRSKVTARKKSRGGSSFSVEKSSKKGDNSMGDCQESSSSPETSNKSTQHLRQNPFTPETSNHRSPDKETRNGGEEWEGRVDLWSPLNYLVEVANRTKTSKLTPQGSNAKSAAPKSVALVRKSKGKDQSKKSKVQEEKGSPDDDDATESAKPKKLRRNRKKKALEEPQVITPQAVVDADANNPAREKQIHPIWFHLVPSKEQVGEPLGQLEGSFLRLKDGNVPISVIQKFVMTKLKLASENEVELRCMGEPLAPTLLLSNLMELWLQSQPRSVTVMIGSSAKEYMMEISYARKAPAPAP